MAQDDGGDPIVRGVTVPLLLFLSVLSAGLALALYRARIRVAELEDDRGPNISSSLPTTQGPDRVELLRLEAAAEAVPVGIIIVNERSEQVFANESALAVISSTDSVLAIRLRDLLATAVGSPTAIEQRIDLFGPVLRTVRLHATPVYDDAARLGTVIVVEDLTDRSRVDSMRRDFITNASHELKTPLGALRLLAEALVATDDADVRSRLGARIEHEATRLTRLVEKILDLASIEEDLGTAQAVDLRAVVAEAITQADLLADILGITVNQSGADAVVTGDHRSLVSAVANLIENALIYTNAKGLESSPPVEVRVERLNGHAAIEVEDRGLGIATRHQDRIFERFYRVDQGRSRAVGGSGLGLAIVRHVVHNHHGRVEVESVPGVGATFRLVLPVSEE